MNPGRTAVSPAAAYDYRSMGQEGEMAVPGGYLRYRLVGPETAAHVIVFENGWTGSFPYAWWFEELLSDKVRILFYDRAGTGINRPAELPRVAGFTAQLAALLGGLGISQPVVIMGHSYGGLMGALHAAQNPAMVKALVQIDPTSEFNDAAIDAQLRAVPTLGRIMQAIALLGLRGPLVSQMELELPPAIVARLRPGRSQQVRGLGGSVAEIRLLEDIRRVVTASDSAARCPRLVISANPGDEEANWLQRVLGTREKAASIRGAFQALHWRQAGLNESSRWVPLPYGHVGLVTNRQAAEEISALALDFLR